VFIPAPHSTDLLARSRVEVAVIIRILTLFIREHAPCTERINKLSNLPITTGVTTKTVITNVCAATATL